MKTIKLINLPRYHVFSFEENPKRLFLLDDNYINKQKGNVQFGWNRIYNDGRTNMHGIAMFDRNWLETTKVIDHGEFYEWMKINHPIRYKREGWEQSR